MPEQLLWAPQAWVDGGWQQQVLLGVSASGHWSNITTGMTTAPPAARILPGPVLPGLVNAHSHAFQRAFAIHAVAPGPEVVGIRRAPFGQAGECTLKGMAVRVHQPR